MSESLQEIPDQDIPLVLDILRQQFPKSIHVYSFLKVVEKWKKTSTYPTYVLAPNGNYNCGAIFFYMIFNKRLDGTFYTWTKAGTEALIESLKTTNRISWKDHQIMFSCMPEDIWNSIEPHTRNFWTEMGISFRTSVDKVFWMSHQDAKNIDVKVPEGTHIRNLELEHAELINNKWPHRHSESFELIRKTIELNFGLGLFNNTGEPIAWSLYWFYGGIGGVHVMEEHRRKGYGSATVQAITKKMGELEIDVHLNVINGNTVGESFFSTLGFSHAFKGVWAFSENKNFKK